METTLLNDNRSQGGIYRILVEGIGSYYGETDNFERRFRKHRKLLASGRHHCIKLRRAFLYTNGKGFIFEIVERSPELVASKALRLLRENLYIKADPMCLNTKGSVAECATETSLPDREIYRNRTVCLQRVGKSPIAQIRLGGRSGPLLGVEVIEGKFRMGMFSSNGQCKLTRIRSRL